MLTPATVAGPSAAASFFFDERFAGTPPRRMGILEASFEEACTGARVSGPSLITDFAALSLRNPWNAACLRRPSCVHSANDTSATSRGLTQCTPRASIPVGGFTNGD